MRIAETIRIAPSTNLSAAAGTRPTSRPPATAPTTDPTPIGATVRVRSARSRKAPSLRWRSTPTATSTPTDAREGAEAASERPWWQRWFGGDGLPDTAERGSVGRDRRVLVEWQ